MSKSDKELAVDIARAYIEASGHGKQMNGSSNPLIKADSVINIIKAVHAELKELD